METERGRTLANRVIWSKWRYILKNITKTHHIFSFLRTVQGPGIQGSIQFKKMRHHRARTVISKKSESPKFIRQTCIFKLILEYFEISNCTKSSSNRLSTKYVVLRQWRGTTSACSHSRPRFFIGWQLASLAALVSSLKFRHNSSSSKNQRQPLDL